MFRFLFILFLFIPFQIVGQSSDKELLYVNTTYEKNIQTVQIYNERVQFNAQLSGAVASIRDQPALRLEFDDLVEDADYYFVKLIHCNADWSKSRLNDIEFLTQYNEFPINDYKFSIDTRIPYVHYSFILPSVKISGNYLALVYREEDPNDIILSGRFMIYDNLVSLLAENTLSSGVLERKTNQQIEFVLNYANIKVTSPTEEIKVVIRQNLRWDNAITSLKPSFIRADLSQLEYRHFNFENNFKGGNEFRFFDLRSINFKGQNIGDIRIGRDNIMIDLLADKSRGGRPYTQPLQEDLNGQFVISNLDNQPNETSSEYTQTKFTLFTQKMEEPVYLKGSFNNWMDNTSSKMVYDKNLQGYTKTVTLKQGWYNYMYYYPSQPYFFEGSHNLTQNRYEVIIYQSQIGSRGDRIVGYRSF